MSRLPQPLRRRAAAAGMATPPAPKCKCSHSRLQHGRQSGQCYATVCGCGSFREKEQS